MSTSLADDVREKGKELWADASIAERYARAEAVTKPFASVMVEKSGLPTYNGETRVLDLASGTGAVVASIYETLPQDKHKSLKIVAGDISQPMLDHVKTRAEKNGWTGVETETMDGNDIKLSPDSITHAFVNFGIFMMDPNATSRLYQAVKPGGFLGISTWKHFAWYSCFQRAAASISAPNIPTESELGNMMYKGVSWSTPSYLKSALEDAGFSNVDVEVTTKRSGAGTPKEFCEAMAMPMKMIGMIWPEDNRDKYVKELLEKMEELLTEEVGGEDKIVFMDWEAIIATGWKPE